MPGRASSPRHDGTSHLVSLLGIRHVALAVNKMDLVDYSADVFTAIQEAYRTFARQIGLGEVVCIPVSALSETT